MADLTILAPAPLPPSNYSNNISGRYSNPLPVSPHRLPFTISTGREASASTSRQDDHPINPLLLSPPERHSRSRSRSRRRSRHDNKPRSASVPPTVPEVDEDLAEVDEDDDNLTTVSLPLTSYTDSFQPFSYRSFSSTPSLLEDFSRSELPKPPPPLCEFSRANCPSNTRVYRYVSSIVRPKTFWRNTRRSALTAPSYSPSSYLVRRSTFIAAGLTLDTPYADLSVLGVESRVGSVVLVPSATLPL